MAGDHDGNRGFATVLAIDTAMAACSAAAWAGGRIVARRRALLGRGHAEALMPMVAAVLAAAERGGARLDAVAVTRGPGAFTGVRIGLAAARGLALARGIPAIGLTTLEVLAAQAPRGETPLLVAIEARRGQVYAQRFPDGPPPEALSPAAAAALAGSGPVRLAGDAAGRLAALLGPRATVAPGNGRPDAAAAARLALSRRPDDSPPTPLYLRPPGAATAGTAPATDRFQGGRPAG